MAILVDELRHDDPKLRLQAMKQVHVIGIIRDIDDIREDNK